VIDRRAAVGALFVGGLVLFVGLAMRPGRSRAPRGNAVVVVNAGATGVDSVVVAPDPPGTSALAGRLGYVAPSDSATLALPAATGDAEIRAWRDGRVVAAHVAYFGGRSWFEVRVGDSAQVGRYRRAR
jgi:hypothetical protein